MVNIETTQRIDSLFERISSLIDRARTYAISAVKIAEVKTRYEVGRYILEDEQQGERAKYGEQVLKQLSVRLMERYGADWTYDTLVRCRKFYQAYANASIVATPLLQLENQGEAPDSKQVADCSNGVASIQLPRFILSWSHYLILMRIENIEARSFYELECAQQQWSVKQLSRQVGSSLYERLALSRKRDEVLRLAQEGQTVEKPEDIIKNPLTLEFLGLKPEAAYTESKLENAIISKIQQFLLELGKGFLFEARQKRFTFDERNFYVDLVFYNRLLKCYVLIDLKTGDLTHQDLGQMQMYVNYYDRYVKQDFENPTIGILLCSEKSDALVELTMPKDSNVYASQYSLYLPDKTLLQRKLKEWREELAE
jgi:predicted nuclease of restriction endonuclease-like (RecB) superfamily